MMQLFKRAKATMSELKKRCIAQRTSIDNIFVKPAKYKAGSDMPILDDSFTPITKNDFWGGQCDSHAWFYFKFAVEKTDANTYSALEIITNCSHEDAATSPQFLLYLNGKIYGGDNNHCIYPLKEGEYEAFVYGYTGMKIDKRLTFTPFITVFNEDVEQLYYDLIVPIDLLEISSENSLAYAEILRYVNSAINLLDLRQNSSGFIKSVNEARNYLKREFYEGYCKKTSPTVTCVGHTHIDVAWLWSVAQTKEKAQRSFANMLELMRKYPDFTFMSSQPVLYKFVKEEAPFLYSQIKQRVDEGRWEPEGSMWLEPDCNLISGESIIRQIYFGKKFFKEEFNRDNTILWLPDTFGFPASLPQIFVKSGIKNFATTKINWNDTNDFPYDAFSWQGIDGSKIDSYIVSAQDYSEKFNRYTTYIGEGTPSHVKGTWDRYRQKDLSDDVLLAYGYGDGGGGATYEFCEKLKRLEYGIPGCPTVQIGTISEFFARHNAKCKGKKKPVWMGELYLEFHRGTYTSMAKNKRNNRKAEYLLGNIELFGVISNILNGEGYPVEQIRECRELLMLNQFHDILPGSAIREVYEQSDKDYEELFLNANNMLSSITNSLTKSKITAFNPTSYDFTGDVLTEKGYAYLQKVPALGFCSVSPIINNSIVATENLLENDFLRVTFNSNSDVVSIYDKKQKREVLADNDKGCRIVAYDDYPFNFDAWEIKEYYKEKSYELTELIKSETVVEGNRTGKKTVRKYLNSIIEQTVWLYQNNGYLDFETEIDWKEEHTVLKAEIPLDINCTKATCDIQFGTTEKSLSKNTSWDKARFEVCAHKFVDYSEADYGVAIMNDCKYGYGLDYKNISLTLLKCATSPNENADKGKHYFKYAIYPHVGNCADSNVTKVALQYNNPVFVLNKNDFNKENENANLVNLSAENIVIEAVKQAEDGEGFILRVVEEHCKRKDVSFEFMREIETAFECDMMENNLMSLDVDDNKLKMSFKPFEIKTLRVKFKNN